MLRKFKNLTHEYSWPYRQAISYLEAMDEQLVLKAPRADVINLPPAKLNTLRRLFELYDLDGSGLVSSSEIADALRKNKDTHTSPQVAERLGTRHTAYGMRHAAYAATTHSNPFYHHSTYSRVRYSSSHSLHPGPSLTVNDSNYV